MREKRITLSLSKVAEFIQESFRSDSSNSTEEYRLPDMQLQWQLAGDVQNNPQKWLDIGRYSEFIRDLPQYMSTVIDIDSIKVSHVLKLLQDKLNVRFLMSGLGQNEQQFLLFKKTLEKKRSKKFRDYFAQYTANASETTQERKEILFFIKLLIMKQKLRDSLVLVGAKKEIMEQVENFIILSIIQQGDVEHRPAVCHEAAVGVTSLLMLLFSNDCALHFGELEKRKITILSAKDGEIVFCCEMSSSSMKIQDINSGKLVGSYRHRVTIRLNTSNPASSQAIIDIILPEKVKIAANESTPMPHELSLVGIIQEKINSVTSIHFTLDDISEIRKWQEEFLQINAEGGYIDRFSLQREEEYVGRKLNSQYILSQLAADSLLTRSLKIPFPVQGDVRRMIREKLLKFGVKGEYLQNCIIASFIQYERSAEHADFIGKFFNVGADLLCSHIGDVLGLHNLFLQFNASLDSNLLEVVSARKDSVTVKFSSQFHIVSTVGTEAQETVPYSFELTFYTDRNKRPDFHMDVAMPTIIHLAAAPISRSQLTESRGVERIEVNIEQEMKKCLASQGNFSFIESVNDLNDFVTMASTDTFSLAEDNKENFRAGVIRLIGKLAKNELNGEDVVVVYKFAAWVDNVFLLNKVRFSLPQSLQDWLGERKAGDGFFTLPEDLVSYFLVNDSYSQWQQINQEKIKLFVFDSFFNGTYEDFSTLCNQLALLGYRQWKENISKEALEKVQQSRRYCLDLAKHLPEGKEKVVSLAGKTDLLAIVRGEKATFVNSLLRKTSLMRKMVVSKGWVQETLPRRKSSHNDYDPLFDLAKVIISNYNLAYTLYGNYDTTKKRTLLLQTFTNQEAALDRLFSRRLRPFGINYGKRINEPSVKKIIDYVFNSVTNTTVLSFVLNKLVNFAKPWIASRDIEKRSLYKKLCRYRDAIYKLENLESEFKKWLKQVMSIPGVSVNKDHLTYIHCLSMKRCKEHIKKEESVIFSDDYLRKYFKNSASEYIVTMFNSRFGVIEKALFPPSAVSVSSSLPVDVPSDDAFERMSVLRMNASGIYDALAGVSEDCLCEGVKTQMSSISTSLPGKKITTSSLTASGIAAEKLMRWGGAEGNSEDGLAIPTE